MSEPSSSPSREAELGAFLRAHRERLTPAEVGLPPGRRRRTPGLRREEVAQLAGLSATWVTWLEQGRPVSMSTRALTSLAQALRLSRAEYAYLFALAGRPAPRDDAEPAVPPALLASVHAIAGPAYLLDRQWNALAWNAAAADLFVGWLDPASTERNLMRAMFLSPALQALVEDWPHRAARLVAEFRVHSLRHAEDPPTRALGGIAGGERGVSRGLGLAGCGGAPGRPARVSSPHARPACLRTTDDGAAGRAGPDAGHVAAGSRVARGGWVRLGRLTSAASGSRRRGGSPRRSSSY